MLFQRANDHLIAAKVYGARGVKFVKKIFQNNLSFNFTQPLTSENGDDIFYIDILNIIEEVCNELFILRIFL